MGQSPNPYHSPEANRQASTDQVVYPTRSNAFRAGVWQGIKLSFLITWIVNVFVILYLFSLDPREMIAGLQKGGIANLILPAFALFVGLPLNVSIFGGIGMGRLRAKQWKPPENSR